MFHSNIRLCGLLRLTLSLVCIAAIGGCAAPNTTRMVPDTDPQWSLQTGKSIRAVTVRGVAKSHWADASATREQIYDVVVETLAGSGFFSSVGAGAGDLNLEVELLSQRHNASTLMNYTGSMTATYRFMDSEGEVIWTSTIESSGSSSALSGIKRTTESRERTVNANMTTLLNELNDSWSKQ